MICIALADLTFAECLQAVKNLEFAEIRLDLLDFSPDQIQMIFSANRNLIAACRSGKYMEDERKALLIQAVEAGAAYVDVEMEASDSFKREIIKSARSKNCQVIVSYRDFEKTPSRAELEHILRWCAEFDPDIIKIACMVHSERDNARLLGLLDNDKRMLIIGMGEKGKITRIVAPLLGSFCTFASYISDKSTGPGQLGKEEMEALIGKMKRL
jgi:3-dehydroquinate dehydratase-1